MVIEQGDIFWADLGQPVGSEPGYVRPVVIVQSDDFNRSRIPTVVGVPLTGKVKWLGSSGNVQLLASETGLDMDSVANVSQIATVDHLQLGDWIGRAPRAKLERILDGIQLVIGR